MVSASSFGPHTHTWVYMSSLRQSAVEVERRTETGAGNKWELERVKDEWGKDSERGCDTLIISVNGSSICAKGQERMVSISFSVNCRGNCSSSP